MNVLGLSAYFHDSAAALVVDGRVVAAASEERSSRQKGDAALPLDAVAECLCQAGMTPDDLDLVVFHERPALKFERLLTTSLRTFPRGLGQFVDAMGRWLGGRLWLGGELSKRLGVSPDRVGFSTHHLSHAASAFLASPFERATVVTADGVGEWATTAIWRGWTDADGVHLEPVAEQRFPHSIGLLYSALTAYLGFRVNRGEYKVMGLASFGAPRFVDELREVVTIRDDGAVALDMRYFAFDRHPQRSFTRRLEGLLGPARTPDAPMALPAAPGTEDARFADIAASLQALTEEAMAKVVAHAHGLTGDTALCMAGGVALNSVANGKLVDEGPFDDVWIQPAAGDAGGALGAALYASHCVLGEARPRDADGALEAFQPTLGRAWSQAEVEGFLSDVRVRHQVFDTDEELVEAVADRLASGQVGGWFQGRYEFGPRALGARSILADPTDPATRDRVNARVKHREPFRPFAPAVRASEADRWFVPPAHGRTDHLAPHMLTVRDVRPEARERLGAVTHVDGSARVQTVTPETNPRLHDLLDAVAERTGVGCVLNTSMNVRGEPLCASPADAYAMFRASDLDFLALERCLVTRAA